MDPALRPRFVVVYQDRRLPLPDGEFVVGRGLACHIRFNAAEVSRQHVKLTVKGGRLIAENLSTTSGTVLNGKKMLAKVSLAHGDELVLGPRRLRIEVEDVAVVAPPGSADESGEYAVDEATRPGVLAETDVLGSGPPASIDYHTCPKCRARVDFGNDKCTSCGYQWPAGNPSAVTGRITLQTMEPPEMTAMRRDVPVVYSSDELTIDAVVSDLALHRAFVPSPLLDPNGTRCELTLLPDGVNAMTVAGVVTSVRSTADGAGIAGMEVRFSEVPAQVRDWIDRWNRTRPR